MIFIISLKELGPYCQDLAGRYFPRTDRANEVNKIYIQFCKAYKIINSPSDQLSLSKTYVKCVLNKMKINIKKSVKPSYLLTQMPHLFHARSLHSLARVSQTDLFHYQYQHSHRNFHTVHSLFFITNISTHTVLFLFLSH